MHSEAEASSHHFRPDDIVPEQSDLAKKIISDLGVKMPSEPPTQAPEVWISRRATAVAGAARYLDLLKKLLTASLSDESAWLILEASENATGGRGWVRNAIIRQLRKRSLLLIKKRPFDAAKREAGEDWPMVGGFTMIGLKRLDNIQRCIEKIWENNVPGDFMECGVWRGGASIFARAVFEAYGIKDRCVWLADSFEGMPKISASTDLVDPDHSDREFMVTSLDQVKANFEKFGLLDDRVRFLKGWFADSLPRAPVDVLSILRLDGDHYSSTMDALNALYDKVSVGGYVIIDDYNTWNGSKNAVSEFREKHQIDAELIPIDRSGVYWQRR